MIFLHEVVTGDDVARLAGLADGVWHECFPGIITAGQIDYMVAKVQSVPALTGQLAEGYRYFIVGDGRSDVGYIGLHPEPDAMFLSKLYLIKDARGHGYSSEMLAFVKGLCAASGIGTIRLTVNRGNAQAIAVYRAAGFKTVREQQADIGGGYIMDDYVMELRVLI